MGLYRCLFIASLNMMQSYEQNGCVTIPRYRYFKTYFFYQLYV
jgi:hypothetical protein